MRAVPSAGVELLSSASHCRLHAEPRTDARDRRPQSVFCRGANRRTRFHRIARYAPSVAFQGHLRGPRGTKLRISGQRHLRHGRSVGCAGARASPMAPDWSPVDYLARRQYSDGPSRARRSRRRLSTRQLSGATIHSRSYRATFESSPRRASGVAPECYPTSRSASRSPVVFTGNCSHVRPAGLQTRTVLPILGSRRASEQTGIRSFSGRRALAIRESSALTRRPPVRRPTPTPRAD